MPLGSLRTKIFFHPICYFRALLECVLEAQNQTSHWQSELLGLRPITDIQYILLVYTTKSIHPWNTPTQTNNTQVYMPTGKSCTFFWSGLSKGDICNSIYTTLNKTNNYLYINPSYSYVSTCYIYIPMHYTKLCITFHYNLW